MKEGMKVVELTKMERYTIMNALDYMVSQGLASFPLTEFRSAYNKLKEDGNPPFREPETDDE